MTLPPRIQVWKGCAPVIAAAIDTFCNRWGPYSTKSHTRAIFTLFSQVIEPAWCTYINELPSDHRGRKLCADLTLTQTARTFGFHTVENLLRDRIFEYCADEMSADKKFLLAMPTMRLREDPIALCLEHLALRYINSDLEFEVTMATMREVARRCQNKQPRTPSFGASNRRFQKFCEYCGSFTELEAHARRETRAGYDRDIDGGAARLSAKYCWGHRPKFLDQTRNSEYLKALRGKREFNIQLTRLRQQSVSISEPLANTGDPALDLFYLNLIAKRATYPDEESILRNEARQLVDSPIDDRKKRMVMLRASGLPLSAIADAVGAKSRQSVSKALSSVPDKYRFDLAVSKMGQPRVALTLHLEPSLH